MKYDATYKIGNTTVHIVSPQNMTKEEIEKVIYDMHQVGWEIWEEYN